MVVSTDKLTTLIDFHRYPLQCWPYHHGDVNADTIDALEELQNVRGIESKITDDAGEVLAQLPAEDELVEIIDTLTDALEMNKADMLEQVKRVLTMLEDKQMTMFNSAEHARDVWSDAT